MNRCRWIQWTVALLPLIVLSQTENDYSSNLYQRCVANHTFLELEDLRSVPCVACGNISTSVIAPSKDSISVAIFVEAQDDHYFPQAIAASLLTHSCRVTMLTSPDMPHNEKELAERILRYVPCDQQALANSLLSIKTIPMVRQRPDCGYSGEILCHVPDRAWVHALYSAVQTIDGLDVMLLEGTSIGALLVMEHFRIPSIAFVNDPGMLRDMLGSAYRNRQISWRSIGWYRWLGEISLNRWFNFAGTSEFMSLNVLRRRLRMRPIRTVPDIWKAPASVIMTTLPTAVVGQDSNLQSFTSPILPPCLPCWSTDKKMNDKPVIMVTTQGGPTSLANARYILKGLSLALDSLGEFPDDCDWEEEEPVHCWYRGYKDLSVVWLPTQGATPVLVPDFVKVEHGSLLDSLARYTNAVAIVTQCVDDTSLWINGLGPPILCWDQSSSPRDMALRLLQLLKKPPVKPAHQTRGDCLRRIVSLVERVANVKRKHGSGWKSAADMGRDLKAGLHLREESTENNGGLFVFAAWCILVSAVVYVIHEKTFPTHTSRLRRHRHQHQPTFTDIMDEIVFRLPELEQTWGIWIDWSKENLSDMEDSVPASAPPERADSKDGNHSTHSVRKRRPAKKRH
jgi:hypothetical protein